MFNSKRQPLDSPTHHETTKNADHQTLNSNLSPPTTKEVYANAQMKSNSYVKNDPCCHCARQNLSINARDACINCASVSADGESRQSPFTASTRCGCEFAYRLKCFLGEAEAVSARTRNRIPRCLADQSTANLIAESGIKGVRLVLRVNDHLRGEEGIRGWVLIAEGKTADATSTMLRLVQQKLAKEGIFEVRGNK